MRKTDLRVVLGIDGEAHFSAAMKRIRLEQASVKAEFENATSALSENASAYEKNKIKAENLQKQIALQKEKVRELKDAYEASAEKLGKNADATIELKTKYEKASASLNRMEASLEKTNKTLDVHVQKAEKAAKKLDDFGDKAISAGEKAKSAGKTMEKYLTAGIVTSAALATKKAVEYEDAFAGVKKTVDGTDEELNKLNDDILNLSTTLPQNATEIAGVAESAGQLGVKVNDIKDFSEVMLKIGMSTNLSAEEASTSLAKFSNVTKMSAKDYDKLGSTIVDLGNNYATTESDIVSMATRLASAGSVTGKTPAQIMAIATALSSVGIEAEAGGGAMSKLMKQLDVAVTSYGNASNTIKKTGYSLRDLEMMASHDSKGFKAVAQSLGLTTKELHGLMGNAKKLEQFSDVAGVSADEFVQAYGKDSVKALDMFITGLKDTSKTGKTSVEILKDMGLEEVRMSNAILALSNSNGVLTSAVDTANSAWGENSALQTEVDKKLETTGSKMKLAKNEISRAAIVFGDVFLPIVADGAKWLGEAAQKFAAVDKNTQKTIAKIAAFVAGAGPAVHMLGGLSSGAGKAAKSIAKLIKTASSVKAGTYTGPLNSVLKVLTKTDGATSALAASSGSFASVCAAGGPLVLGLVATAGAVAGLYAGYRELTEGERAVVDGIDKMMSGFGEWDTLVDNSTNLLSGLNKEIFVSSEEAAKINDQVSAVQKDITQISLTAAKERRKLTDAEVQRLDELFQKLNELTNQELEFQKAYQDAAIDIAQTATDFSRENTANLLKTAQDAKDGTIQLAEEQRQEKMILLKKTYEEEGTLSAEEYQKRQERIQAEYEQAVTAANEKNAKVAEITAQGYFEQNIKGNEHLQNILKLNEHLTDAERAYNDRILQIQNDKNMSEEQKLLQSYYAWGQYHKDKKATQKEMAKDMDTLNADELAAWVEMSANTEVYGGKITAENQQTFDKFLGIYDNLPRKAKRTFKDTMQGMLDGIKEKRGELFKKASELADGFISNMRKKFDSHSPSRVMIKLFGEDILGGGVIGVKKHEGDLLQAAGAAAESFLGGFDGLDDKIQQKAEKAALQASNLKASLQVSPLLEDFRVNRRSGKGDQRQAVTSNQTTNNFESLVKIENANIRSEADIRKLAQNLNTILKKQLAGKGDF